MLCETLEVATNVFGRTSLLASHAVFLLLAFTRGMASGDQERRRRGMPWISKRSLGICMVLRRGRRAARRCRWA